MDIRDRHSIFHYDTWHQSVEGLVICRRSKIENTDVFVAIGKRQNCQNEKKPQHFVETNTKKKTEYTPSEITAFVISLTQFL